MSLEEISEISWQKGLLDQSATLEVFEKKERINVVQNIKKTKKQLLVTGTPVFDDTGDISLVIVNERDMTQLNAVQEKLKESRMEAKKIRDELSELSLLELKNQEIIAENDEMRRVLKVALKLSNIGASNILLLGESGVGKGLFAMFIHKNSRLGKEPFIQINCAALPDSLLEAELFGYEKGAFTGAREKGKVGLIELAKGGTLFLDEIGDLPNPLQAKLLKYLDDGEVLRLGGIKPQKINCTIIAATNRNLEQMVQNKKIQKRPVFPVKYLYPENSGPQGQARGYFRTCHRLPEKIQPKISNKRPTVPRGTGTASRLFISGQCQGT